MQRAHACRFRELLALVCDAIDHAVSIVAEQQRAILRERHIDRATPDVFLSGGKADDEVLVFAGRFAILEGETDDLVAGAKRAIPRSMQSDEGVAVPWRGELAALIESKT